MELIPIFLGGSFSIVCAGAGLLYVIFKRGRGRWRGLLIAAVGLIGLFPLLMVVPPPGMSLRSLSGTYAGRIGGGLHEFSLHPDGTFDQRFTADSGKVSLNHGTWGIDMEQRGRIDFHHLLMTWDADGPIQEPTIADWRDADVRLVGRSIYFGLEDNMALHPVSLATPLPRDVFPPLPSSVPTTAGTPSTGTGVVMSRRH